MLQKQAATQIQSAIRCLNCRTAFNSRKGATIEIQRFVRGHTTRNSPRGVSVADKPWDGQRQVQGSILHALVRALGQPEIYTCPGSTKCAFQVMWFPRSERISKKKKKV